MNMKKPLLLIMLLGTLSPFATVTPSALAAPKETLLWPTMKQGRFSYYVAEVSALQYLLRAHSFYRGKTDGVFGSKTAVSVRAFQRANKLKADGVVSAQTWRRLVIPVKRGSRGDAVRAVQAILRALEGENGEPVNPELPIDGLFGRATESAVKTEQDNIYFEKKIPVDGIVGLQTWSRLLAGYRE